MPMQMRRWETRANGRGGRQAEPDCLKCKARTRNRMQRAAEDEARTGRPGRADAEARPGVAEPDCLKQGVRGPPCEGPDAHRYGSIPERNYPESQTQTHPKPLNPQP